MTCIVGIAQRGKVWMGADSAGVDGALGASIRKDRKIFVNSGYLMGFTSSFRMGQLLAYSLKIPKRSPEDDLMEWMVTSFVDAVRICLNDGGYARKKDGEEEGGTFLVGVDGRLFSICDDYQVQENLVGYDACGCGDALALGALHATAGQKDPRKRILAALEAAQAFSAGVRAPFHVMSV